jgi:hypothetical protein
MRIWLYRREDFLAPTDEESLRIIRRYEQGEMVPVRIERVRSIKWHRLYFGLCRLIGENQDPQRDESSVDGELRWRAGHRELLGEHDGKEIWIPKRIAFDQLTGDEWSNLWPSLELAMRERFGIGPEHFVNR